MTQQPDALRLADRLDLYATGDKHQKDIDIEDAAAELRRLHEIEQSYNLLLEKTYAQPAQRQPLTNEQINDMWMNRDCVAAIKAGDLSTQLFWFARAIEAAHGIKENT
jgi:hypothetical protein